MLTLYNENGFTAGVRTFTLSPAKNGTASTQFMIPYGAVLTIEETAVNNYSTTVNVGSGTPASALAATLTASQTVENLTVTFTNTEVYVAPTGVTARKTPYVWVLLLGSVLAAGAVFVLLYRKRRKGGDAYD